MKLTDAFKPLSVWNTHDCPKGLKHGYGAFPLDTPLPTS